MEAQGDTEEALQAFSDFARKNPDHFLTTEAKVFGRARCMESLNPPRLDDARTVYEDFIGAETNSVWLARAEQELERINTLIKRGKGTL
jgi:hypothetical protein